ncbi:MAG: UrcA family protein [Candidatus Azotimanducaceae bacterium]|jgi:UrcA family protein
MIKKILLAAALSTSVVLSASASLTPTVRVDFSDVNLATMEGQERLNLRIGQAAKLVCGSTVISEVGSLKQALNNRSCIKKAISSAQKEAGLVSSL